MQARRILSIRRLTMITFQKNDEVLPLCPHCKKPTLSALEKSAIDSAIDYLNGKRMFNNFPKSERKFFSNIFFMLALGMTFYFIFNHI